MKSLRFFIVASFATLSTPVFSQVKTETFKVAGVCSMCKKKIESAAKVGGLQSIIWDEETKLAKVSYDSRLISLDSIQKKIAGAGYDTEKFKAEDKVFKNLPECCRYERPSRNK
ncbi:heavy-metal-associated domain-containing protein [Desertivirga arenae]|uniref:heavy-metal-associated domain-containing protein n=1 Tax=Desertivirga arenae TaxID=2810309 RepID=UPI001A979832|nr:heavy-metal-associated domain-containing protein [Pedobacter sp. SYSU D00823]